jgi:hypothetical protein
VVINTIKINLPEPSFLAGLDRTVAGLVGQVGNPLELLLAASEVLIGIHVLRGGRLERPALWAGIALSSVFWVLGQNFGGILAGGATDPNSGPLYVLLAATLYPRHTSAYDSHRSVERDSTEGNRSCTGPGSPSQRWRWQSEPGAPPPASRWLAAMPTPAGRRQYRSEAPRRPVRMQTAQARAATRAAVAAG